MGWLLSKEVINNFFSQAQYTISWWKMNNKMDANNHVNKRIYKIHKK